MASDITLIILVYSDQMTSKPEPKDSVLGLPVIFLELENSVFLHFVLLGVTPAPVASNSFSFPSLRSSDTATLSSACFWIFLLNRIQSGEETDAGRQRLNHSSLSLSRFSELYKALDTNEYNWWRVFIFLPQELQARSDLSSARNILFARIASNEPVYFEGWNKFSVPIWSSWEPNLTHRRSRGASLACYQSTLISGTPFFSQWYFPLSRRSTNEILWEIVASSPFLCPSRLRRSLARSRETRFTRRACSQAKISNILLCTALLPITGKSSLPWWHVQDKLI